MKPPHPVIFLALPDLASPPFEAGFVFLDAEMRMLSKPSIRWHCFTLILFPTEGKSWRAIGLLLAPPHPDFNSRNRVEIVSADLEF